MKIVLLHYAAPPVVGGVESVIGHHARLLAADGHHVSIIAGRGAQTNSQVTFKKLPIVDSRHPDVLAVKADLDRGKVPPAFRKLRDLVAATLDSNLAGVDVLIAHNVCSLNKNLPLTAALRTLFEQQRSFKLILWHHDLAWTSARYQNELYDKYPWNLLKIDLPGAVHVTVSEPRRQDLSNLLSISQDNIKVVPNGVDVHQFWKLEDYSSTLIDKLDLLRASPLFLLPVRITVRKNIELAIQTMAACLRHYPELKLVVTGPLGPHNPANTHYFNKLKDLRSQLGMDDRVVFLAEHSSGYIPDKVISDFYRLADALILPSREEGFGIPILEAGISSIPVFCTDIPTLYSLGGDRVSYFSPDSAPEYISSVIIHRLESDQTFRLRSHVKKNYTWRQIYEEHIKPLLL